MADRSSYRYVAPDDEKAALEAVKSILPQEENEVPEPEDLHFEPKQEVLGFYKSTTTSNLPGLTGDHDHGTEDSRNDGCNEHQSDEIPVNSEESGVEKRDSQVVANPSTSEQPSGTVVQPPTSETVFQPPTSETVVQPPTSGTLCDVVAAHYNNVPESGLDERNRSRILHLRNFNNWIKSMLIDEYLTKVKESKPRGSSLKVLDMGCGKGGDLFKWRQGKITHLVCADIAGTSIEQCKERYEDLKQRAQRDRHFNPIFSAEFIVANCTKERLRENYQDVTVQLDLVSCQFAFHYCFESLPQAECMMRNAAECLRPGGYFFGTCPNANAIVSRVRKAGGKKFGNDVYSVEFDKPIDDEVPPPIFGAKYNFHMEGVVDCPEFLVHFPTFIRLASRFGLEFVVCEPFQSFFDRMKEKGRGLLGKMQSLETYPPFPDQALMGALSQYQHADLFINTQGVRKLGTLSKSEWEAATLYLIFVFKKQST